MNVSLIKAIVKDLPDDEKIVTFWFDKEQANDMSVDNDEEPVTEAEWLIIWEGMSRSKYLNQIVDEQFNELYWKVINQRKGKK
jgi:N12 class adenine-specific DNA methylase